MRFRAHPSFLSFASRDPFIRGFGFCFLRWWARRKRFHFF
jgi:hypothetical protein